MRVLDNLYQDVRAALACLRCTVNAVYDTL